MLVNDVECDVMNTKLICFCKIGFTHIQLEQSEIRCSCYMTMEYFKTHSSKGNWPHWKYVYLMSSLSVRIFNDLLKELHIKRFYKAAMPNSYGAVLHTNNPLNTYGLFLIFHVQVRTKSTEFLGHIPLLMSWQMCKIST